MPPPVLRTSLGLSPWVMCSAGTFTSNLLTAWWMNAPASSLAFDFLNTNSSLFSLAASFRFSFVLFLPSPPSSSFQEHLCLLCLSHPASCPHHSLWFAGFFSACVFPYFTATILLLSLSEVQVLSPLPWSFQLSYYYILFIGELIYKWSFFLSEVSPLYCAHDLIHPLGSSQPFVRWLSLLAQIAL